MTQPLSYALASMDNDSRIILSVLTKMDAFVSYYIYRITRMLTWLLYCILNLSNLWNMINLQTKTHVCLITDYCPGGELFLLLDQQPKKVIKEDAVRYIMLLHKEFMHIYIILHGGGGGWNRTYII